MEADWMNKSGGSAASDARVKSDAESKRDDLRDRALLIGLGKPRVGDEKADANVLISLANSFDQQVARENQAPAAAGTPPTERCLVRVRHRVAVVVLRVLVVVYGWVVQVGEASCSRSCFHLKATPPSLTS